jgi:hypothetical protein
MIVPEDRQRIRHVAMAVFVFLGLSLIFSMAREPIGAFNAWILAVSGEIKVGDDAEVADGTPALPAGTNAGGTGVAPTAAKPPPPPIDMLKPVLSDLPKTTPVHVVLLDRLPSSGRDPRLVPAPPLRIYTGFAWDGEKTDLRFASDGDTLYVWAYCHDRSPADLCTEFTEAQGASSAWMDDSIELFLMRDRGAGYYCQYVVSASGMGVTFYLETTAQPHSGHRIDPLPTGFRLPHLEGSIQADGYVVTMEIPLANLGIERVAPGTEILCQVVRNYRGYQRPGEVNLQLFPAHIYGDNRLPELNHHRNAFQPIRFITPQEAAKLPPPPPDDFADVAWE